MKPYKTTTLDQFLTDDEIKAAVRLYKHAPIGTFAKQCEAQIIRPVLPRIEAKLGQRMHPRYVAYMVEYVLMKGANE